MARGRGPRLRVQKGMVGSLGNQPKDHISLAFREPEAWAHQGL
jgi:hypothetical protein